MTDQPDADHAEQFIHEHVALGALTREFGRIIELDRDDGRERRLVTENKVDLLVGEPIEGRLVRRAVGDFAQVANARLQKDLEAIAYGVLQYVVEDDLDRRQKRLAPERKTELLRHGPVTL